MALVMLESSRPDEFAAQVKEYRNVLGWSQQDLADRAGCSRPTIARLEDGRVILSLTMNKVIDALNEGLAAAARVSADVSSEQQPSQISPQVQIENTNTGVRQDDARQSSYDVFGPVFSDKG